MLWHLVLAAEKAGVVGTGLAGEGLDAGAGGQRRGRLVETDVAVGADAEHLDIDAPCGVDLFLILCAMTWDIGCISVRDMDVLGTDIGMPEKVFPHKAVVGLRVFAREADVFVEVEGGDLAPIEIHRDKRAVKGQWRAAGGEAEDRVGLVP